MYKIYKYCLSKACLCVLKMSLCIYQVFGFFRCYFAFFRGWSGVFCLWLPGNPASDECVNLIIVREVDVLFTALDWLGYHAYWWFASSAMSYQWYFDANKGVRENVWQWGMMDAVCLDFWCFVVALLPRKNLLFCVPKKHVFMPLELKNVTTPPFYASSSFSRIIPKI